ncbi:MAG: HAD family hydrolase [Clostridia bacterium]|nr:HAD family hydrolase [Clostridia bacterium]
MAKEVSKTPYRAVLFDLDGTLLDTLDDLTASCNTALAAYELPLRGREEVRRFVGHGIAKLIRRAAPRSAAEADIAGVMEVFKAHYALHNGDRTRPYEGVPEMLEALRRLGCKIAVVSNKNDENVKKLAGAFFGIKEAVGDQAGLPPKPAPDGAWRAMKALGADAGSTLYVGDSEVDLQTARNAGLACLAVTWGFRSREELRAAGAAHFADHPAEIVDFVRRGCGNQ